MIKHWVKQWWIAFDQLCNACIPSVNTWADETFSSRCHRLGRSSSGWAITEQVVNHIFFWELDHCRQSYDSECARRQSPPESR